MVKNTGNYIFRIVDTCHLEIQRDYKISFDMRDSNHHVFRGIGIKWLFFSSVRIDKGSHAVIRIISIGCYSNIVIQLVGWGMSVDWTAKDR